MTKLFFGVIASICAATIAELHALLIKAKAATSCEIRLDSLLKDAHKALHDLVAHLNVGQKTILTYRSKDHGGCADVTCEDQWHFWTSLPEDLAALIADPESNVFIDFDFRFMAWLLTEEKTLPFPWSKIGCSRHLKTTPDNLKEFFMDLRYMPARAFHKFVPTAHDGEDVEAFKKMLRKHHKRHGNENVAVIAFMMGEAGKETRTWCLRKRRSAGTYGYIRDAQPAAAGQFPIDELLVHPDVIAAIQNKTN